MLVAPVEMTLCRQGGLVAGLTCEYGAMSWSPQFVKSCEAFAEGAGVFGWQGMCDEIQEAAQLVWVGAALHHPTPVFGIPLAMHRVADESFPCV